MPESRREVRLVAHFVDAAVVSDSRVLDSIGLKAEKQW